MKASYLSGDETRGHFKEPFFADAIRAHADAYRDRFRDRLAAVYVWGSVHRNEAVPGISDLDLGAFIEDDLTTEDEAWYGPTREILERAYPGTAALVRPRPVRDVLAGLRPDADEPSRLRSRAYTIRLHFDATRVRGRDLLAGLLVPPPGREWAQACFRSVHALVRFAAGLEATNATDFDLPEVPIRRLRKLARLGVLGGAYLLMASGDFRSFEGADILPVLGPRIPDWTPFLRETASLYIRPDDASMERCTTYLAALLKWTDWVARQI